MIPGGTVAAIRPPIRPGGSAVRETYIPGVDEFNAADAAEQYETADRQPEPPTAPEDLPLEAAEADAVDQSAEIALDEDDERF